MPTGFPTTLDVLANPAGSDLLSTGHAGQHANLNDAVEALQAKVGVDNSPVTTSLDYRVAVMENNRVRRAAGLAADVVVTNNAAATTLIQATLDLAEAVAGGASYEVEAAGYFLNNSGVAYGLTFGFRIGGTVIYLDTTPTQASGAQARGWHLRALVRFQSGNIQRVAGVLTVGGADAPTTPAGVPGTTGGLGAAATSFAFAANAALVLGSSGTTTLDLQHTHAAANANLSIGCTAAIIRRA